MSQDLSLMRARLLSRDGDPSERAGLVDQLPSKPDPAVVVGILTELLAWETHPLVQARALRRLGRLGDAATLAAVHPFLENPRPEVVAAAAEAVLRLDRQRGVELVAPLLDSANPEARAVVLRSLLDVGNLEGSGVVVRLSMSESLERRRMALEILGSISTEVAWPLALRMFEQETDPGLLADEAALLERILPEKGIEKLYDLRLALDVARDDGRDDPLLEPRLDLTARMLAVLFQTFRLTDAEIAELEDAFHARAKSVLTKVDGPSVRGDPRIASASMKRPRPASPAAKWAPVVVAALLILGVGSIATLSARQRARASRRPPPLAPPTRPGQPASVLGNVNDEVAFEAEAIQVDPARRTLVVLKDRAIGVWVFAPNAPWALLAPGNPVQIAGHIVGVKDARNLYVEADSVAPAARR